MTDWQKIHSTFPWTPFGHTDFNFISDQDICGGYFCGLNGENFTLNDRVYVYIVLKQNIALFDFVFKCITNPKLCLLKAIDKQKRIDIAMAILKLP